MASGKLVAVLVAFLVLGSIFVQYAPSFISTTLPITGDSVYRDITYKDRIELSRAARLDQPCIEGRRICDETTVYECQNNKYTSIEECPLYCSKGACVDCLDWTTVGTFSIIKGHYNQCRGDDLYTCNAGRWEKLVSCPNSCENRPMTGLKEGVAWAPFTTNEGELVTIGHCHCEYGDPDLCIGETRYKCLGWGLEEHSYTRIGACGKKKEIFVEQPATT